MRLASYLALLLTAALFVACANGTSPTTQATDLSVEVLLADDLTIEAVEGGAMGAVTEERREVITDTDMFETRWNELYSHRREVPDPPSIDFEERVVVFAALGQRPTGGYGITLDRAVHDADEGVVELTVREVRPGQGCMVTQALTFPYLLATVDVVDASYEFVEGDPIEEDC